MHANLYALGAIALWALLASLGLALSHVPPFLLTGLALGLIEGLTKVFYAEASSIVVFVIMALVLMVRPAGLFGKEK
jgi:branched-subunit amino acid ABC-type transport system permease component